MCIRDRCVCVCAHTTAAINASTACIPRLGHSLVPRFLPTPSPSRQFRDLRIRLRDHFLRPAVVRERFDSLALGLVMANATTAGDQSQAIDRSISREVGNWDHLCVCVGGVT